MLKQLSRDAMLSELHAMRMELEASSSPASMDDVDVAGDDDVDDAGDTILVRRGGSVRGRRLHVLSVVRSMCLRMQLKRDYVREEEGVVVVYMTSCGILRSVWDRCREAVDLLYALRIKVQLRDLNISPELVDELIDRMQILRNNRGLVFDSLPVIYADGNYFGNCKTLVELNERKELKKFLAKFQGAGRCVACGGGGYVVCRRCDGGKRIRVAATTTSMSLRCASCDRNGIAVCEFCGGGSREKHHHWLS